MKILLDYFFPITAIEPTPAASTAFLKNVLLVVKPKGGAVEDTITLCTTSAAVAEFTDNEEADQLFAGGLSRVYVVAVDDLDLDSILEGVNDFFTILISSDFADNEIDQTYADGTVTITSYANLVSGTDDVVTIEGVTFTAQTGAATLGTGTFRAATDNAATAASLAAQINAHATIGALVEATVEGAVVTITALRAGVSGNDIDVSYTDNDTNVGLTLGGLSGGKLAGGQGMLLGEYAGVVGISSTDDTKNATRAAVSKWCAFHTESGNGAQNMCYAFGKLLSNSLNWLNQQYISMPVADDVETLGDAEALFDDKISFVISDDEFGERLALFCAGGKAITAPYIRRNLEIDLQSAGLSYISGNQPAYTLTQAALLEDELQKVMQSYIDDQLIENGTVEVALEEENFVASTEMNIAEPNALWRIFGNMRQTL